MQGAFAEFGAGLQVDHERTTCLHGAESGVNTVGQPALFPYLGHQACAEGATTQDLVAQRQGSIVRIVPVDTQLREHQVGLLGRELDMGHTWLGFHGLCHLGQGRAFGQGCGDLCGNAFGVAARQVAYQGNDHVARGIRLVVEGAQLLEGDAGNAFRVAIAGVRIRVAAVQLLEQFQAGQFARVLLLVLEAGKHLVLDAGQGVGGEGRLADHFGEEGQGGLALVLGTQAAQRCHGHVAVGTVAKVSAQAFEAFGNRTDILAGHTFVEHGVGQHGQTGSVLILAAAGGEGQAQVEHR
ncbi:hypothetical protein D3C85_780530 [compost metagenome]